MRRRILTSIVTLTAIAVVLFGVPLGFALADLYHEEEIVGLGRVSAEVAEEIRRRSPGDTWSRRLG